MVQYTLLLCSIAPFLESNFTPFRRRVGVERGSAALIIFSVSFLRLEDGTRIEIIGYDIHYFSLLPNHPLFSFPAHFFHHVPFSFCLLRIHLGCI